MTALPKKSRPANDQYPPASQKMSYVALSYPRWNNRAALAIAGLAIAFAVTGLTVACFNLSSKSPSKPMIDVAVQSAPVSPAPAAAVAAIAPKKPPAYDIRLDQSELAPPEASADAVTQIVSALPDVGIEKSSLPKGLPPVLDIKMEDEEGVSVRPAPKPAAKAAPMIQNLKQAILYDRADEPENAIPLYRAALAAYDAQNGQKAASFDPAPVRARLDYLVTATR